MADPDTIAQQLERLAQHRATLAGLLHQQALHGAANTPPPIFNGIRIARGEIRRIKAWVREYGQPVDDHPDDDDPDTTAIQKKRAGTLRARFVDHTSFINNRLES